MLRPERMSKVSVTGSRSVMPSVIETIHEMNLVHLSDYDGSWEGFDNGNPIEGADDAAEKLVTVRALESTLELSEDDAEPGTIDEEWETRLESVRTRINELDDRRGEIRDELRQVDEKIDRVAPFAELGIELDLLSGYDSVDVVVGEGSHSAVEDAVAASDEIRAFETFAGGDIVAIVAAPANGAGTGVIDDALVGVDFTRHEVPETEKSPSAYVDELEARKRELSAEIDEIDAELEEIKDREGPFLLRVEEELTIEVQRAEAPLQFATTERAFVAEGWIPSASYDEFSATLDSAFGERLVVEELERAQYTSHGVVHHGEGGHEAVEEDEESERTADEPQKRKAATDGGTVTMDDDPPIIQDNPKIASPFEVMVKAVNQPKYYEFDPTIALFLTFPLFFGFMIGDVGYGLAYMLIGYFAYSRYDGTFRSIGEMILWTGAATVVFGVLYGEVFGLHLISEYLWEGQFGMDQAILLKGLGADQWALAWLVVAVLVGIVQLNLGYLFDFVELYQLHGAREAIYEAGSWILMLNGLWIWIFSDHLAAGNKPEFLFEVFNGQPFPLGFAGFSEPVGIAGGLLYFLGLGIIAAKSSHELPEFLVPMVHVLSYTRLTAVLLAKAGMALVANMLYFGAYQDSEGGYHFLTSYGPDHVGPEAEVLFSGLMHGGTLSAVLGIPVLVIGHVVVLAIGGTAALQAIRLEYVEFFEKFYEGGGETFNPFGYKKR